MKQHQDLILSGFCALLAAYCFYFEPDSLVGAGGWIIAALYLTVVWLLKRDLELERLNARRMRGLLQRSSKS